MLLDLQKIRTLRIEVLVYLYSREYGVWWANHSYIEIGSVLFDTAFKLKFTVYLIAFTIHSWINIIRSLPYLSDQNISLEQFSYASGRIITEVIQMQLLDSAFSFIGVSVSETT